MVTELMMQRSITSLNVSGTTISRKKAGWGAKFFLAPCFCGRVCTISWEQRKLGNCAEFNPKSELPETFEYVDLESVVGTDILSHRTESKSSAPSRAQRLAQKGDVFYQTVRPYQKNNCIFEKDDNNWVFSTGYAQLRSFIDGYFLVSVK